MRKSTVEDLTGRRFGRLMVVERAENKGGKVYWRCACDCGNETIVESYTLRHGHTRSCGCFRKDESAARNATHGFSRVHKVERLYHVWLAMKGRCSQKNHISYKNYGGKGIKVCDEWMHDYPAFREWALANGYVECDNRKLCSIDRIDKNGDYEPSNCRWASQKTQCRNKTTNRFIEVLGETITFAGACDKYNIPYCKAYARVNKLNWDVNTAFGIKEINNDRN